MKNLCNSGERYRSLSRINRRFRSSYSLDGVFTEQFNNELMSFQYRSYPELELTVEDYKSIVLTDDIRKGIIFSFDDGHINFKTICLERTVTRIKKFSWIISNFIDDDGLYSHFVLLERLCEMNHFPVPTKNK